MTRRLQRRADGMRRTVTLVADVGERLPFPDASFDCVVTTLMLCMVADLHRVVGEARRVLRPGGTFLFYEHVASPSPRIRRWQGKLNPVWRFLTTGCNLNRDISAAIRAAGFSHVEVNAFSLSVAPGVTIPNIIGMARA